MFKKEIEELNKAIKHLENDILPSKCNGNISCYNEHTQLYKWLKELKSYKEIRTKNNEDIFEKYAEKWWYNEYSPHTYTNSKEVWKNGAEFGYNKVKKELEEEKKLNAEIKARFVKCNTCTDEMKSKCLMFTENLCEGERCEELIDIVSLVNKSDLERKIEALEKANEWHYVKDGDLPPLNTNVLVIHRWARTPEVGKRIEVFINSSVWVWAMCSDRYRYTSDDENVIAWKEIVLPKESE